MKNKKEQNEIERASKKSFFSTRTLIVLALLSAISIILSRFCVIYFTENLRLSFGNIPIIIAGLLFGPLAGALVGGVTDILGSLLLSGLGWYPPLTVTPVLIGLVAGLLKGFVMRRPKFYKVLITTVLANAFGTICWSTYALSKLYGSPIWSLAAVRVPFYIGIACLEAFIIYLLIKSGVFKFAKPIKESSKGEEH